MDIQEKLNQLETELSLAKGILFSKKGVVDIKKCEDLLFDIKRGLPPAIQEASYLLAQKDRVIANAQKEAERIIAEAKQTADELVATSVITKRSEQIAAENCQKAEKYCNAVYDTARENVDKILKNIEDYLKDHLRIIQSNREELVTKVLPDVNKKSKPE